MAAYASHAASAIARLGTSGSLTAVLVVSGAKTATVADSNPALSDGITNSSRQRGHLPSTTASSKTPPKRTRWHSTAVTAATAAAAGLISPACAFSRASQQAAAARTPARDSAITRWLQPGHGSVACSAALDNQAPTSAVAGCGAAGDIAMPESRSKPVAARVLASIVCLAASALVAASISSCVLEVETQPATPDGTPKSMRPSPDSFRPSPGGRNIAQGVPRMLARSRAAADT